MDHEFVSKLSSINTDEYMDNIYYCTCIFENNNNFNKFDFL